MKDLVKKRHLLKVRELELKAALEINKLKAKFLRLEAERLRLAMKH